MSNKEPAIHDPHIIKNGRIFRYYLAKVRQRTEKVEHAIRALNKQHSFLESILEMLPGDGACKAPEETGKKVHIGGEEIDKELLKELWEIYQNSEDPGEYWDNWNDGDNDEIYTHFKKPIRKGTLKNIYEVFSCLTQETVQQLPENPHTDEEYMKEANKGTRREKKSQEQEDRQ